MRTSCPAMILLLCGFLPTLAAEEVVRVADDNSLRAALGRAGPGTRILIAAGNYRPGVYLSGKSGTAQEPIVIEGADADHPPLFEGGGEAWHLVRCNYVTLRHLHVRGQSSNGINCDNGTAANPPAHHLVLEDVRVGDVGPRGNHDAIKLSGIDDFVVRGCTMAGWGGQAPDMVGCHRGLIEDCKFLGKEGSHGHTGPQTKGGSSEITIRRCLFVDAADRGVQLGGSTGRQVFRPLGATFEAKDITVENCVFVGCEAAVAFAGVDGAVVRHNTIYRPRKWVMRILQETRDPGFVRCRNGVFEHNLIVFREADVQVFVNIGPDTLPETFRFARNLWYCEDRPTASRPRLPTPEVDGVYGVDPQLEDPAGRKFRPLSPAAARFGAFAGRAK